MFKKALGLAACAVLGACAHPMMTHGEHDMHARGDRPPSQCFANVHVVDEKHVVVDSEPLHPKQCGDSAVASWRLKTDGWTFDRDPRGIVVKDGEVRCEPRNKDTEYVCYFDPKVSRTFRYSINVQRSGVQRTVDPTVIID